MPAIHSPSSWPIWQRNLAVCWLGGFIANASMTMVLPFLPLYMADLGVHSTGAVEQWSGLAFGATFLMAALVAPLWGRLADEYGRKLMLIRASLGMAIVTTAMAFATQAWHLVALRFLMGAVSGYVSASNALIATETPRDRAGWALGVLITGAAAGGLIGPLMGGYLADRIGLRHVFLGTGGLMFVAFLFTSLLLTETFRPERRVRLSGRAVWAAVSDRRSLVAMGITAFLLMLANLAIEPIVTVYVGQLVAQGGHVASMAGVVVAAGGIASVIAAPLLGRLADRIGPRRVLVGALGFGAVMTVPQAWVHDIWQLMALRFGFGLAAGGMLPTLNSLLRAATPDGLIGRIYGYAQSAQYLGALVGPIMGGVLAAHYGIPMLFYVTAALLAVNAVGVYAQGLRPALRPRVEPVAAEPLG